MTNSILANIKNMPTPIKGMGVTILSFSDREAGTIQHVSASGKMIRVTYDISTRIDTNGISDVQEYTHTENPTDDPDQHCVFTLRSNGRYVIRGGNMFHGRLLIVGSKDKYFDPHF